MQKFFNFWYKWAKTILTIFSLLAFSGVGAWSGANLTTLDAWNNPFSWNHEAITAHGPQTFVTIGYGVSFVISMVCIGLFVLSGILGIFVDKNKNNNNDEKITLKDYEKTLSNDDLEYFNDSKIVTLEDLDNLVINEQDSYKQIPSNSTTNNSNYLETSYTNNNDDDNDEDEIITLAASNSDGNNKINNTNKKARIYTINARRDEEGKIIGWYAFKKGNKRITFITETKEEIIEKIKELVAGTETTIIVNKKDGDFQEKLVYTKDK